MIAAKCTELVQDDSDDGGHVSNTANKGKEKEKSTVADARPLSVEALREMVDKDIHSVANITSLEVRSIHPLYAMPRTNDGPHCSPRSRLYCYNISGGTKTACWRNSWIHPRPCCVRSVSPPTSRHPLISRLGPLNVHDWTHLLRTLCVQFVVIPHRRKPPSNCGVLTGSAPHAGRNTSKPRSGTKASVSSSVCKMDAPLQ